MLVAGNDLVRQVLIILQRQGQLLVQPHRQQPDLQLRQRLAQAHPLAASVRQQGGGGDTG